MPYIRKFLLAAALCCAALPAAADEYSAGDPCSSAGAYHVKNDAEGVHHLVCDGSNWQLLLFLDKDQQVGIGTDAPAALLHAEDGDFLVTGTHTGTSAVPVTGAGTRMFFHPEMSAFRAGYVGGTHWNDSNIGPYSAALGLNTTAGHAAMAWGSGTSATGNYSTAFGLEAVASGARSVAVGLGDSTVPFPEVSGTSSVAMFMGAQNGVDMSANKVMALLGGKMVIDPNDPAAQTAPSTGGEQDLELDVEGDIGAANYCDEDGNNCFAATDVGGSSLWTAGTGDDIYYNSGTTPRVGIGTDTPGAELDVAGDIHYTGVLVDTSDRRMKDEITALNGQLEKIATLQGVSFIMKDDPDKNTELGLIAQEVEAVYPELVRTGAGGIKSLNYIGLTAPLIEAVKELKSENDQLRQDNEAIRARLHALENRLLAVPPHPVFRQSRTRPAYNN